MSNRSNYVQSFSILLGFILLCASILYSSERLKPVGEARYQLVQLNSSNIAIIDNQTNKIFFKYISPNEGPSNWEEIVLPN
jgi:hypothetical protein